MYLFVVNTTSHIYKDAGIWKKMFRVPLLIKFMK